MMMMMMMMKQQQQKEMDSITDNFPVLLMTLFSHSLPIVYC